VAGPKVSATRVDAHLPNKYNALINRISVKICVGRAIGKDMNDWGIPDWLEREVKERDKTCIYCGAQMIEQMPPRGPRKAVATWEHIINDASIVSRKNIARCCAACNSSKGSKKLSDWIRSSYCKKRGINKDTVAEVVKEALRVHAKLDGRPSEGV
jgi:hypothetical protein